MEQGVVTLSRSSLGVLAKVAREPLAAIPVEAASERMVVTRNFGMIRAYISDPALVQDAYVRNADKLVKAEEMVRVLGAALGDGLLTADGPSWRWQRQAISPAFHHERLQTLIPAMISAAEATRDRWLAMPEGSVVELGHEMMKTTFDIILDTMLSGREGIDATGVERSIGDFLGATPWMFAMAILKAPSWMPHPGYRTARTARNAMRSIVRAKIVERRDALRRGHVTDDLLGKLLAAVDPETGRSLGDEAITDNILTFITAGHETTAIALGWTFMLLAENPDCATRLLAEIDRVTGGGPVRPDHIADLVYARQVVSETMRLYPPAPLIARSVAQDLEVGGVTLPVGSILYVPIFMMHRHVALWPRPEAFDPERFTPDAIRSRHRLAYIPFGAGPRICIGLSFATMEAVAVLAVLLKALRLDMIGPAPRPTMRVTLRPATPLRMRVVRSAAGHPGLEAVA